MAFDFLDTAVWIWDFLIMELLPLIVIFISLTFTVRIVRAIPVTVDRWETEMLNPPK